jgi:hypothetical protein
MLENKLGDMKAMAAKTPTDTIRIFDEMNSLNEKAKLFAINHQIDAIGIEKNKEVIAHINLSTTVFSLAAIVYSLCFIWFFSSDG